MLHVNDPLVDGGDRHAVEDDVGDDDCGHGGGEEDEAAHLASDPAVIFSVSHLYVKKATICTMPYTCPQTGLGSILDTVSKDTEDTAPLVSVSVS